MRRLLAIILLFGGAALLLTRAEPLAPTVVLETPVDVVGRATALVVVARDRGTGLAHVEVRLASGTGAPAVLAREDFPRPSRAGPGGIGGRRRRGRKPPYGLARCGGASPALRREVARAERRFSEPQGPRAPPGERPPRRRRSRGRLPPRQPRAARRDREAAAGSLPRQRAGALVGGRLSPAARVGAALRLRRPPHLSLPRPADRPPDASRVRPGLVPRQPRAGRQQRPRRVRRAARHLREHGRPRPRLRALLALRPSERDRGDRRRHGQARRHHRQDGRHRPRGRRPSPLQHHDPRRPRRPGRVVGRALDPRPRRVPSRGLPAGGSRPLTARHAPGTETLARLGLDAAELTAGRASDDEVLALLAGPDGVALADALGELPHPAVATLLARLEGRVAEKAVRKAIRRTLYRLSQRGVARPAPAAEPERPRVAAPEVEGLVSAFDGRGDRILWLLRPLTGGTLLVAAQLNEPGGLRDLQVVDAGRKQLRAARERLESENLRLVPARWAVLDALLVEAQERAGTPQPGHDYLRVRPQFTTEPAAPPAEPVSPHARPPANVDEASALAAGSVELVEQPEFRGRGPDPEAATPYAGDVESIRRSPIVLTELQQEERLREVLARATAALYPPAVLARRLEGTAYVLAETGRPAAARLALAVATLLRDAPQRAHEIPFVAALVGAGIPGLFARSEAPREGAIVLTPEEVLKARRSSRPGHTRG